MNVDGSPAQGSNGAGDLDLRPSGSPYALRGKETGSVWPLDTTAVLSSKAAALNASSGGKAASQEAGASLNAGGLAQVHLGEERTGASTASRFAEYGPELSMQSSFAARTPLDTPAGSRFIEDIRKGDLVWARSKFDPDGAVEAKVVEEVFVNFAPILTLGVFGQKIRTTGMHPFFAQGKGWTAAQELKVGDLLLTKSGDCVPVESLEDTGECVAVYNLRVADFHTYFVGCREWSFSVWVHNRYEQIHVREESVRVFPRAVLTDDQAGRVATAMNQGDEHGRQTARTVLQEAQGIGPVRAARIVNALEARRNEWASETIRTAPPGSVPWQHPSPEVREEMEQLEEELTGIAPGGQIEINRPYPIVEGEFTREQLVGLSELKNSEHSITRVADVPGIQFVREVGAVWGWW